MKCFRRVLSVILCLVLIFILPFSVFGISIKSGMAALRKQYKFGEGPETQSGLSIDYRYFSPVKSKNDKTKYPLMVILTGQGEHKNDGDQIEMNEFCAWSADEYQKRFVSSKGAYILFARAREELLLSWNQPSLITPLSMAVEDFANKNSNVDKERIYVYGWSYGGIAALRVAAERPDMFAGVISASPPFIMKKESCEKLKNMAVWMILSKNDTIAPYSTMTYPTWESIRDYSNNKENIRLTTYDDAPNTEHIINHNSWLELVRDFDVKKDGYSGRKTIDGNSKEVSLKDGMLSWISKQKLYTPPEEGKCVHECHIDYVYLNGFWRIRVRFWKLFDVWEKRYCVCGAGHW